MIPHAMFEEELAIDTDTACDHVHPMHTKV